MDNLLLFFAVLLFRSILTDPQTPIWRLNTFFFFPKVVSLLQTLGCVFDSSLFPILCSGRPPSIDNIKSIIGVRRYDEFWRGKWGVYIVVLEKSGCRPILYVGSSVNRNGGLYERHSHYFSTVKARIPIYVQSAIQNGYEMTYFAVPFYFTMPSSPALMGFGQSLVLGIEHTPTFRLWTMYGRWTNCERLALWEKSAREYDGANSHSCMFEVRDLEEKTPEEIELYLQERAKRDKIKEKEWRENHVEERRELK